MSTGRNDVAAGIVSYNPDISKLKENINCIINQVSRVYIYDNGSANINELSSLISTYGDAVSLYKSYDNNGVARALNALCSFAINDGFNWIVTLDQDSVAPPDLVKIEQSCINRQDIAIVSPKIVYKGNEEFAPKDTGIQKKKWVITSGSLMNLKAYSKIGGFDNQLFIDGIDFDYCVRAGRYGFIILVDNDVILHHELGNLKCRRLFGKTIFISNHRPERYYYMSRNAVYLSNNLHDKDPRMLPYKLLFKTFFFEKDKLAKINMIIKGIHDGKRMISKYIFDKE